MLRKKRVIVTEQAQAAIAAGMPPAQALGEHGDPAPGEEAPAAPAAETPAAPAVAPVAPAAAPRHAFHAVKRPVFGLLHELNLLPLAKMYRFARRQGQSS